MLVGLVIAMGLMIFRDVTLPPDQPVREAIAAADAMAQPGYQLLVGFATAHECVALYGREARNHTIAAGSAIPAFLRCEQDALKATGHKPWVIVSYESMMQDFDSDFWLYFRANYRLVLRLDGRVTPVAIYSPREGESSN
jgi:hypothetical protein